MTLCEVDHVYVVAHPRAVRGRVVVTEDSEVRPLAHRHLVRGRVGVGVGVGVRARVRVGVRVRVRVSGCSGYAYLLDEGHEVVRDALRVLPDAARGVRPDRVEVAEQADVHLRPSEG